MKYKLEKKDIKSDNLKPFLSHKEDLKIKDKSFFALILSIDAYIGDTYLKNHFTQNSFIFAYRNNQCVYELRSSYIGLKLALQFLNKQKTNNLIFVGNPRQKTQACRSLFSKLKVQFFASDSWIPGFISKNTSSIKKVLVIYDISTNSGAKNEAFRSKLPIVGFISKYANINGIDYPVCLNFENCGFYYLSLWKTFFLLRKKKYIK